MGNVILGLVSGILTGGIVSAVTVALCVAARDRKAADDHFVDVNNKEFADTFGPPCVQGYVDALNDAMGVQSPSEVESRNLTEDNPPTVASIRCLFAVGKSCTEAPEDSWTDTVPGGGSAMYLWRKAVVTFTDGSETASDAIICGYCAPKSLVRRVLEFLARKVKRIREALGNR